MSRNEEVTPSLSKGVTHQGQPASESELSRKIEDGSAIVGICGLGYVGLPLVFAVAAKGYAVIGFDTDPSKIDSLRAGRSYLPHIAGSSRLSELVSSGRFRATVDYAEMSDVDIVVICVPTPLTRQREPDLSYVVSTATAVAEQARPGQLVVLESTTFPGTTVGVLRPIFEKHGLESGRDVFLAFCPEREDPGNRDYDIGSIPRVVGGDGPAALALASAFYSRVVGKVVQVSTPGTAEAVKLTENIFRAVNIALVNELKQIYGLMGIDIWEVIDAAKTKPFGFMPFYPGPGLGGHCIPIDPFYLTWKAREFDIDTRLIELAGQINTAMPQFVIDRLAESVDRRLGKGLSGSHVLLVGLAYKRNIGDIRESPALRLMQLLAARGAQTSYHDPFVPEIPTTREFAFLAGRKSVALDRKTVAAVDAILLATDHDDLDYHLLSRHSRLVIDTRNAFSRRGISGDNIVKA